MMLLGRVVAVVLLILPCPQVFQWLRHGISWTPEVESDIAAVAVLWMLAAIVHAIVHIASRADASPSVHRELEEGTPAK